jgi:hypothetical protein
MQTSHYKRSPKIRRFNAISPYKGKRELALEEKIHPVGDVKDF